MSTASSRTNRNPQFDRNPSDMTRQELYDAIRQSSLDEVVLEEMLRLGFWPPKAGSAETGLPEAAIKRQTELQQELNGLVKKQRLLSNPDEALRAMHNKRKAAARQKRIESKHKQAVQRYEKAQQWWTANQTDILFLGQDTAVSLQADVGEPDARVNHEKLATQQLPALPSAQALADAMGIGLNELKFLAYARKTSTVSHYQRFAIPKKTGGAREISAPMPRLKRAQYWLLDNVLQPLPVNQAAHGFVRGRSIVSNAQLHVGQDVVINCDLKDFFPSITYARVKGWFASLGYAEQMATILALLCTEQPADEVQLDGQTWYVGQGHRRLPQGAPTSPAITNQLCRRMDARLQGIANKLGFNYTRYADDLTFSASGEAANNVAKILSAVRFITAGEGFELHPDKTRVMRKGVKQEVTGIVVNDKLSVDRQTLRKFRAVLHRIRVSGLNELEWQGHTTETGLLRSLKGYANFVAMVDAERGHLLRNELQTALQSKALDSHQTPRASAKTNFRIQSAAGKAPLDNWWIPVAKPPPPPPTAPKSPESKPATSNSIQQGANEPDLLNRAANQSDGRRRETNRRQTKGMPWWLRFIIIFLVIRVVISLIDSF